MIGLLASGCVAVGVSPDGVNGDAVLTPPPASAFEAGKDEHEIETVEVPLDGGKPSAETVCNSPSHRQQRPVCPSCFLLRGMDMGNLDLGPTIIRECRILSQHLKFRMVLSFVARAAVA